MPNFVLLEKQGILNTYLGWFTGQYLDSNNFTKEAVSQWILNILNNFNMLIYYLPTDATKM